MNPFKRRFSWFVVTGLCLSHSYIALADESGALISPYSKGIQRLRAISAREKSIAQELRQGYQESATAISRIAFEIYGQERDPARILLEIDSVITTTIDGIEEGRRGQVMEPIGRVVQLGFDLVISKMPPSPLKTNLQNVNFGQQVGHEVLRATQNGLEARMADRRAAEFEKIQQGLIAKERAWIDRQSRLPSTALQKRTGGNKPVVPPPSPPTPRSTALEAVPPDQELEDWIDHGHRKFADRAAIERFYQKWPELRKFQQIAEYSSPANQYDDWKKRIDVSKRDLETKRLNSARAKSPPPDNNSKQRGTSNRVAQLEAERRGIFEEKTVDITRRRKQNSVAWDRCTNACPSVETPSKRNECLFTCNDIHVPIGKALSEEHDKLMQRVSEIDRELRALR